MATPLTLGELRAKLAELPDSTQLVVIGGEDSFYNLEVTLVPDFDQHQAVELTLVNDFDPRQF